MTATGVRHWLSSLNLPEQYEALLLASGYDTLTKCGQLSDTILEQIGIKPVGHRKRILLHLPFGATEMSTPDAYDSDDDGREIYDIPPLARKSGVRPEHELMYTNFEELNEIPKPFLPPKKHLSSSGEVDARLGIVSPPVMSVLAQDVFGTSTHSTDIVRAKPKLCVVYPEKRPPVPARRVSKDAKASSGTVENQLNNNIKGFSPAVLPGVTAFSFLKHQDTVGEDVVKVDTDTVPFTYRHFSESCTTAVGSVSAIHRFDSVDNAPRPSPRFNSSSGSTVSEASKLNSGLEHELQEIVSSAKKLALGTAVDSDTHTSSLCSTDDSVDLDDTVQVCSMHFDSDSCEKTGKTEESLVSKLTKPSSDLFSFGTSLEQRSSDCHINVCEEASECVYVMCDESPEVECPSLLNFYENEWFVVKDLKQRKEDESDNMVYKGVNLTESGDFGTDEGISSIECQYSPPSFSPPPLPAVFTTNDMFEFSTHLKPSASYQEEPSSRTSSSTMSGFAHFAEERAKHTDLSAPQAPPRRRRSSTNVVDDTFLSPEAAGFSSALDDYLTQKVTSPCDWLNLSSECFGDVSVSEFGPLMDLQHSDCVSPTKMSEVQLDTDTVCFFPAAEDENVYESGDTTEPVVNASVSTEAQSFNDSLLEAMKPLSAEDFTEVECNNETGT